MLRKVTIYLIAILSIVALKLEASHGTAGEIIYNRLGINTYEISIITYTDSAAQGVDRCFATDIEIIYIDPVTGQPDLSRKEIISNIPRSNGPVSSVCPSPAKNGVNSIANPKYKVNVYKFTHTFNSGGSYVIRYFDKYRVAGISNISNSSIQSFYVETILNNNPFLPNSSPILYNEPLEFACVNEIWKHNPGAYDPDGDSLVYSLIPAQSYDPILQNNPVTASNYTYPNVNGGGSLTINPNTGLIVWDVPQNAGSYVISILIEEYRFGIKVGSVIRDMLVIVSPTCNNNPPIINAESYICVEAGELIQFDVTVTDPDIRSGTPDSVYLLLSNSGVGQSEPFQVNVSPANFSPVPPISGVNPITGTFTWQTVCEHIRSYPYQVDFSAHDNLLHPITLYDYYTTQIKILPPSPNNLSVTSANREATISWSPTTCNGSYGFVEKYLVYKKVGNGPDGFDTVCCTDDITNFGYQLIGETDSSTFSFIDNNNGLGLSPGMHCYRVVAMFNSAYSTFLIPSCPSDSACTIVEIDFPLLLNVDVEKTDDAIGEIFVKWARPEIKDSANIRPPYHFKLFGSTGQSGSTGNLLQDNIAFTDTFLILNTLSTLQNDYHFYIEFHDSSGFVSRSDESSSIFLTTTPGDQNIALSWTEKVSWQNQKYYIYRSTDFNGVYTLIDSSVATNAIPNTSYSHFYTDTGLQNGQEYCYYVESVGAYLGKFDSLYNKSQIACAIPRDTTPPCLPDTASITIDADCETFTVDLSWNKPDSLCAPDVAGYNIYFARYEDDTPILLQKITNPNQTTLQLNRYPSIAGCYYLSVFDTAQYWNPPNESGLTRAYCFDNCPIFEVTNIFSPNNDGVNDYFAPYLGKTDDPRFREPVKLISCKIYDRWGKLVHENYNDLYKLWDGKLKGGQDAKEGVYFYIIEYEYEYLDGFEKQNPIMGNVTLLR